MSLESSARFDVENAVILRHLTGAGYVVGDSTLTLGDDHDFTFSGVMGNVLDSSQRNTVSLRKIGAGTMTLAQTAVSTGASTINAGTLQLGAENALPSGLLTLGNVTASTSGTLILDGHNQEVAGLATAGPGGTIVNGSPTAATLTVNSTAATTFTGTLGSATAGNDNNFGLRKIGAEMLSLSGANYYTGQTTIEAGTLRVDAIVNSGPWALGNDSAIVFAGSGATAGLLDYAGIEAATLSRAIDLAGSGGLSSSSLDPLHTLTYSGTVSSSAGGDVTFTLGGSNTGDNLLSSALPDPAGFQLALNKVGAGKWILGAGVIDDGTNVTVSEGTLDIGSNNLNLGTLTLNGGTLAGTGTLTSTSDWVVQSGNISAVLADGPAAEVRNLWKTTSGTASLLAINTYSGQTFIEEGTLNAGVLTNSGNYSFGSNTTANILLGNVTSGTAGLMGYVGTTDVDFNRTVEMLTSNSGLSASGTGNLTYSGTIVNSVGAATNLVLDGTGSGLNTLTSLLADTGGNALSIRKMGSGRWVLDNTSNSFTGTISIEDGTLGFLDPASLAGASITVGTATTLGTLEYVGSSDHSFTQAFALAGLGGGIGSSGTGNVTISSVSFTKSAASTFVLSGLNTGDNIVNVALSDSSGGAGVLSILKRDPGTWILNQVNSYTGTTIVAGGTLRVGVAGAIPTTNTVYVGDGTLDYGTVSTNVGNLTLGGLADKQGKVTIGASNTLTLVGTNLSYISDNNGLGGLISGGTLSLGATQKNIDVADSTNAPVDLEISSLVSIASGISLNKTGAGVLRLSNDSNAFNTSPIVSAGVMEFTSLTDAGLASAVGTSNPTLSTGTWRYVGGDASSNRDITFTSSSGRFESNNALGTTLTLNGAIGSSSGNVTFGGTGNVVINGVMTPFGANSIVFWGSGDPLNPSVFTLNANNNIVGGDVSVNANATVIANSRGALGTVSDDLFIYGNLAINAAGAFGGDAFNIYLGGNVVLNADDGFYDADTNNYAGALNFRGTSVMDLNGHNWRATSLYYGVNAGAGGMWLVNNNATQQGTLTLTGTMTAEPNSGENFIGDNITIYLAETANVTRTFFTNGTGATASTVNIAASIADSATAGVVANLQKTGPGTLVLKGMNTYTGATQANAGTLVLDYSENTGSKLADAAELRIGGATVRLQGNATEAVTEDVGSANVTGRSEIQMVTAGTDLTFNLNSISRTPGGALRITYDNAGGGVGTVTTDNLNYHGILSGGITVVDSLGYNWAYNAGGGTEGTADGAIRAFTAYSLDSFNAGDNTDVSYGDHDLSLATFLSHSLRFNGTMGTPSDTTVTLPSVVNVLSSGGIMVTPSVGPYDITITGGSLTPGGLTAYDGYELTVLQNNLDGRLIIESPIVNNGETWASLGKHGVGTLVLSGASTYGGATYVTNGELHLAGGDNRLPITTVLNMGDADSAVVVRLKGNSQQLAGLQLGSGALNGLDNKLVNDSSTHAVLTIANPTGLNYAFGGQLGNTTTGYRVDENNFSLVKAGGGTLTLNGSNAFTGTTTVQGGTLLLNYQYFNNNKIWGGNEVIMAGGILQLNAALPNGMTQNTKGITFQAGGSRLVFSGNSSATATQNFNTTFGSGKMVREAYATNLFSFTGNVAGRVRVRLNDGDATEHLLGGWAVYGATNGNNTHWAALLANRDVISAGNMTTSVMTAADDVSAWTSGINVEEATDGFYGSLAADLAINSLRFNVNAATSGTNGIVDLGGYTLTLTSGGMLMSNTGGAGIADKQINNGYLRPDNAYGELFANVYSNRNLYVNATVVDNGTTATNVIKSGLGNLRLNANNTYTGKTFLYEGTTYINSLQDLGVASSLGAPTTLENGTIVAGSIGTVALAYTGAAPASTNRVLDLYAGNVNLNNTNSGTTNLLTWAGSITSSTIGPKHLQLYASTSSAALNEISGVISDGVAGSQVNVRVVTNGWLLSGENTYTGYTEVLGGGYLSFTTLGNLGEVSSLGAPTDPELGTIRAGSGSNAFITYVGTDPAGVDTNRSIRIMNTGSGQGTVLSSNGTGALVLRGGVTLGTANAGANVWLRGNNTSVINEIAGVISDGVLGGTLSIMADNAVTWKFSNANTYTGTTTVRAGVLQLAAADAISGGGAVNINVGGTLQYLADDAIGTSAITIGNATGVGTLDLNGFSDTVGLVTLANGTISGNLAGGAAGVLTSTSDFALQSGSVTAILAGDVGVTKTGAGTVVLGGANLYTGSTAIEQGTLAVTALSALGTPASGNEPILLGTATTAGSLGYVGTAALTGSRQLSLMGSGGLSASSDDPLHTLTWDGSIVHVADGSKTFTLGGTNTGDNTLLSVLADPTTGVLSLTKEGTGKWILGVANTYTGATTINGGTLVYGTAGAISDASAVTVNAGGVLDMGSTAPTFNSLTIMQGGTLSGTYTVTQDSGYHDITTGQWDIYFGGLAGLRKTTSATAALLKDNTYYGRTLIEEGTLQIASLANAGTASSLGQPPAGSNAAKIVLGTEATAGYLEYIGSAAATTDRTLQLANATGGLLASGTGVLTWSSAIENIYGDAATLVLGGSTTGVMQTTLADFNSQTLSISKTGTGTWTLASANSYSGLTTVSAGTLTLGVAGAIADGNAVTVSGGTLDLGAFDKTFGAIGLTSGTITGTGSLSTTQSAFNLQGGTVDIVLAGSGTGLNKTGSGTLTLNRANTYTGLTSVSAGTLALGIAEAIADGNDVAVSGGTLNLGAFDKTFGLVTMTGGTISGTGTMGTNAAAFELQGGNVEVVLVGSGTGLNKTGTTTLNLNQTNTYTGLTTISDGTLILRVAGAIADGNDVAVSGGTLNLGAFDKSFDVLAMTGGTITGTGSLTTSRSAFDLQAGTVDVVLTGAIGLNKTGSGTLTLTKANTYSGETWIKDGTLSINQEAALGTSTNNIGLGDAATTGILEYNSATAGTLTRGFDVYGNFGFASGGTGAFTIDNTFNFLGVPTTVTLAGISTADNTVVNAITNDVALIKKDAGRWILSGSNSYTGGTTIDGGQLVVDSDARLGSGAVVFGTGSSPTLAVTESFSTSRSFDLGSVGGGFDVADTKTLTITSDLLGSGSLSKSGEGTLSLSGSNSYVGLSVLAGTLQLGGANAGPNGGLLTMGGSGVFDINGYDQQVDGLTGTAGRIINSGAGTNSLTVGDTGDYPYAGTIEGGIALTKVGSGSLSLDNSGNSYTGGTTIDAGRLVIGADGALGVGGGVLFGTGSGPTLAVTDSFSTSRSFDLGAVGGALEVADGKTLTITSDLQGAGGSLTKTGTGSLALGDANSYTGGTTIEAGRVVIGADGALGVGGSVLFGTGSGPTLQVTGNIATSRSFDLGTVGGTFDINSLQTLEITSVLLGAGGSLTKSGEGTLKLSNTNTYSGGTLIEAGTVDVAADGALGTGEVVIRSGAMLQISTATYTASDPLYLRGTGAGGLGALYFSGSTNFTGEIIVTLDASIGVAPGQTLTMNGGPISKNGTTLSFTGGGTVNVNSEITGSLSNSDLVVDGVTVVLNTPNSYNGVTEVKNGGTLRLGNDNVMPTSPYSPLRLDGATSTFDMAGYSDSVARLSRDGTVTNTGATLSTLTIGDSAGPSKDFSGVIEDGTGGIALVKSGRGIQILSGINTYSGGTTIHGGAIRVIGSGTLGADVVGNDVTVNPGGVLRLGSNNLGANQILYANSNATALAVIGVGFDVDPNAALGAGGMAASGIESSSSGVLALSGFDNFQTNVDFSALGDGTWFLGATELNGTFTGAALTPGAGNTYRLGGGGGTLTIATTNLFSGSTAVLVGSPLLNGTGTVVIAAAQNYTGGTTIDAGGTLQTNQTNGLGSTAGVVTLTGGNLNLRYDAATTFGGGSGYNVYVAGVPGTRSVIDVNRDVATNANLTASFGDLTLGAGTTLSATGGNGYRVLFSGVTLLEGDATLNTAVQANLNGQLNGNGYTLTSTGAGNLWITNTSFDDPNSLGRLIINQGGVIAYGATGGSNALGDAVIDLIGGTLYLRHDGDGVNTSETLTFGNDLNVSGANPTLNVDRIVAGNYKTLVLGDLNIDNTQLTISAGNNRSAAFDGMTLSGSAVINNSAAVTFDGVIADAAGSVGYTLNKSSTGAIYFNSANTFDGGFVANGGTVIFGSYFGNVTTYNDTATLGTGDAIINNGASIRFNASTNVNAGQTITIASIPATLSQVQIRSDEHPSAFNLRSDTSGVLALYMANYTQNLNLARIGDGTWYLGSYGSTTYYDGTSLGAGSDGLYRFGAGGSDLNIQAANIVTGASGVMVGSGYFNGGVVSGTTGNVRFMTDQDYTGATTLYRGSATAISNTMSFRGSLATSSIEIGGRLIAEYNSTFIGMPAYENDQIVLRPGSALRLDHQGSTGSVPDKWGDDKGLFLPGASLEVYGRNNLNNATSQETIGELSYRGGAGVLIGEVGTGQMQLNVGELTRVGQATLVVNRSGAGYTTFGAAVGTSNSVRFVVTGVAPTVTNGIVAPSMINWTDYTFMTYGANGFANYPTASYVALTSGLNNPTAVTEAISANVAINAQTDVYALRMNRTFTGSGQLNIHSGGLLSYGAGTISGPVFFGDGSTAVEGVIFNNSTLTMSGALTADNLTKFGPGTLILTAANDITGNVQVNGGTLQLQDAAAAGTASITLDGASYAGTTLQLYSNAAATFNNDLILAADLPYATVNLNRLTSGGTGTLTMNRLIAGTNEGIGQTLNVTGAYNLQLAFANGATIDGPGQLQLITNNRVVTISGAISGDGGLLKGGSLSNNTYNHLILDAPSTQASTYSGGTTLTAGYLSIRPSDNTATTTVNALGTGPITLSGGILELRSNSSRRWFDNDNNNILVDGNVVIELHQGTGTTARTFTIGKSTTEFVFGTGNPILTVTGNGTASHNLTIDGVAKLTGKVKINNGVIVEFNRGVTETAAGAQLVKIGAGILILDGTTDNTYSGGTTINEGFLRNYRNVATGTGRILVNPGGGFSFEGNNTNGTTNAVTAGQLHVVSNPNRLSAIGIRYVGATQADIESWLTTSTPYDNVQTYGTGAILGVDDTAFNTAIDMATLGNGYWYLGSTSGGNYTATTLGVGAENTYRLGTGTNNLYVMSDVLVDGSTPGSKVTIGAEWALNGNGGVVLYGNNTYTGGTVVKGPATTIASNSTTFAAANSAASPTLYVRAGNEKTPLGTGLVDVYGLIIFDTATGSAVLGNDGVSGANANEYAFHPTAELRFEDSTAFNSGTGATGGRWADTAPIFLDGAYLNYRGNAAGTTEVIGALSFDRGADLTVYAPAGSATTTLQTSSLTRVGAGTLTVNMTAGTGAATQFLVNYAPNMVNGMVAPYIVNRTAHRFLAYDSVNGFVAVDTGAANYQTVAGGSFGSLFANTGAEIVDLTAAGTLDTNLDVWAFRTAATLNAAGDGADTITLRSGGWISAADASVYSNLVFGPTGNGQGLFYVNGTTQFYGQLTGSSAVKFGGGTIYMRNDQADFGGTWHLNDGILGTYALGGLGTGEIVLNGSPTFGPTLYLRYNGGTADNVTYTFGKITAYDNNTIQYAEAADRESTIGDIDLRTTGTGSAGALRIALGNSRVRLNAGTLTIYDNYVLNVDATSYTNGGSAVFSVANLAGSGKTLTTIGDGVLHINNGSNFTDGTINITAGVYRATADSSLGGLGTTANVYIGGALEIATANFAPTATLNQYAGSVERWSNPNARYGSNYAGNVYTLPAGVNLQLETNVVDGPRTIQLDGGSVWGYLRSDDVSTTVYRTAGALVSWELLSDSYLGRNLPAGIVANYIDESKGEPTSATQNIYTYSVVGAILKLEGDISGAYDLTKVGTDIVVLSGSNTYNNTKVLDGVLQIGANNSLPIGGVLTTDADAVFDLNGFNQQVAGLADVYGSTTTSGRIINSAFSTNTLTVGDAGNYSYAGYLEGGIALTKVGLGNLTLVNLANTYVGPTTIEAGRLIVAADGALGNVNGEVIFGTTAGGNPTLEVTSGFTTARPFDLGSLGGTLQIPASQDLRITNVVQGAGGSLTKTGSGRLLLENPSNTYSGGTVIQSGRILVAADGALGDAGGAVSFGTGIMPTLQVTSGFVTDRPFDMGTVGGTLEVPTGADLMLTGTVVGTGSLTASGGGNLTLTGSANNTFSGDLRVETGMVTLAKTGAAAVGGNIVIGLAGNSAPEFLVLGASDQIPDTSVVTFAGGSDIFGDAAVFALNGSNETVGGLASLASGDGIVANGHATLDATLTVNNAADHTFSGILANNQTASGGTLGLTKTGSGNLTLAGTADNINTGLTTVNDGRLILDKTGAIAVAGDLSIGGGIVALNQGDQIATGSSVIVAGGTLDLQAYDNTVNGLSLVNGTVASTIGTLTSLTNYDVQSGTISAMLAGGVGLDKTTAGLATLSGVNSYTGATTVSGGTLLVDGTINSATTVQSTATLGGSGHIGGGIVVQTGATLSPGNSIDTLTVDNGNVTFQPGGIFQVELELQGDGSVLADQLLVMSTGATIDITDAILDLDWGTMSGVADPNLTLAIIDNVDPATTLSGYFADMTPVGDRHYLGEYYGSEWYLMYNVDSSDPFAAGNDVVITNVPEPSTVALLVGGAATFLGMVWRRRKQRSAAKHEHRSTGRHRRHA